MQGELSGIFTWESIYPYQKSLCLYDNTATSVDSQALRGFLWLLLEQLCPSITHSEAREGGFRFISAPSPLPPRAGQRAAPALVLSLTVVQNTLHGEEASSSQDRAISSQSSQDGQSWDLQPGEVINMLWTLQHFSHLEKTIGKSSIGSCWWSI